MLKKIVVLSVFSLIMMAINAQVNDERLSGSYEGAKKKELADGFGKAVGKDTYEGSFKKGLPDGVGIYIFGEDVKVADYPYSKGDRYEGTFKKGLFEGKGKIIFADPEKGILDGFFKKGKFVGKTQNGYEWIKTDSENVMRVIVRKRSDSKNDISLGGISDLVEIGKVHSTFNSNRQTWTDIRSEDFPFVVYVRGKHPNTNVIVKVKVLLESPGTWSIRIDPK